MSALKHASDTDFEKIINSNKHVIVDFYADWCGPCKIFAPVFEGASLKRPEVLFVKVDTDKAKEVASKYKVSSIPTVAFFKDGIVVEQFLGYKPTEEVFKFIDRHV